MKTRIILALGASLVVAGSLALVWACGGGGSLELRDLTVQFAGQGFGQVTMDGHSCITTCTKRFNLDETVTLTASPNAFSSFQGWSGHATGSQATALVKMDDNKTVTATFERLPAGTDYAITATGSLGGTCDVEQVPSPARPASAKVALSGTVSTFEVTLLGGGVVTLTGTWNGATKLAIASGPRSCQTPTGCTPSTVCHGYQLTATFTGAANEAFTGTWAMNVALDPRCGPSLCVLNLPVSGAR